METGYHLRCFFLYVKKILKTIARRFIEDRLTYSASALTYTTLLALVPLLTVILTILSAFPAFRAAGNEIQQFIFSNFIPASGSAVQSYLQSFIQQAGQLSFVGTSFLVVTALMMMITVDHALNAIWQTSKSRYTLTMIIRYWTILSLVPILVGLSMVTTSYLVSLPLISDTVSFFGLQSFLSGSVPYLFAIVALSLLYTFIPNCKVPFQNGFIGAIIATILFESAKKAFVIYLMNVPTYRVIYGAIAVIPIFLLWIYISWVIVLFGALISNVLTHPYRSSEQRLDGFTQAFLWLGYLWKAYREGKGLSLNQLSQITAKLYELDPSQLVDTLKQNKLIHLSDNNEYRLSQDFSTFTLAELYHALSWKLPQAKSSEIYSGKIYALLSEADKSIDKSLRVPLGLIYENYFDDHHFTQYKSSLYQRIKSAFKKRQHS